MDKIAVFGSAFNPPSLGHKSVIDSISHFDLILLIPSIAHAWGKNMVDYSVRCSLVDAFICDLNMSNVKRSDIEEHLVKPDLSVTTFDVLHALSKQFPNSELTFVLGPDNLFAFDKFYRSQDIIKEFSILACPERVAVRSTDIRNNVLAKKSIHHLTTLSVIDQIRQFELYQQKE